MEKAMDSRQYENNRGSAMVLEILREALNSEVNKQQKERPGDQLTASNTTGCLKKIAYGIETIEQGKVNQERERTIEELMNFYIGTVMHENFVSVISKLARANYPMEERIELPFDDELLFSGQIDLQEPEDDKMNIMNIWDWKFVGTWTFRYVMKAEKMKLGHYMQAIVYADLANRVLDQPEVKINLVYFDKGGREHIVTQETYKVAGLGIAVPYTVYKNKKQFLDMKKGSVFCPMEKWECKYCEFAEICR